MIYAAARQEIEARAMPSCANGGSNTTPSPTASEAGDRLFAFTRFPPSQ